MKCPDCGKQVSKNDKICPRCGCPMEYFEETPDISSEEKKRLLKEKREKRNQEVAVDTSNNVNYTNIDKEEKRKIEDLKAGKIDVIIPQNNVSKETMITKVVGVTFENRQELIKRLIDSNNLFIGATLSLVPEPTNYYDKNAVKVIVANNYHVGYLAKTINQKFSSQMMNGKKYIAIVKDITGGSIGYSWGITIEIQEK